MSASAVRDRAARAGSIRKKESQATMARTVLSSLDLTRAHSFSVAWSRPIAAASLSIERCLSSPTSCWHRVGRPVTSQRARPGRAL